MQTKLIVDDRSQNKGYIGRGVFFDGGIWEPYLVLEMFYILNSVIAMWVYTYVKKIIEFYT